MPNHIKLNFKILYKENKRKHAYTHTHTHARTHARTHTHAHTRTHTRTHTHARTHVQTLSLPFYSYRDTSVYSCLDRWLMIMTHYVQSTLHILPASRL